MSQITGDTKLIAVIGDPISQVRAPALVNAVLDARGINAICVPMHVPAGQIDQFMTGANVMPNLVGLIVTVPHKFETTRHGSELSQRASITGATNVLRKTADGWYGDVLDGLGFVRGMERQGHELTGRRALLVGAGGAGTAIGTALLDTGLESLEIFDLDGQRQKSLVRMLAGRSPVAVAEKSGDLGKYSLVINATTCGLAEQDPLPLDVSQLDDTCIVADIIMKPPVTRFLVEAQKRGLMTQEGRHMLDTQIDLMADFFFPS